VTPLLAVLIGYAVTLILIGVWVGRRVRHSADFFVSNRALGTGLIFATFLAPNIGAGSTVGATALAYHQGLSAWWWNGSAGLGSLVLAFWVGPRIWREATRLRLLTVGDFLEHHFGRSVRGLAALSIWFGSLLILCAQLDGVAAVLNIAGGVPHGLGAFIGAAVMTAYFAAGGLAGTARVNSLQLFVKLAGFGLATPLVIAAAGGWNTVHAFNPAGVTFWRGSVPTAGWPRLFLLGPAFFLSPGLLQKSFAARDEKSLTRGVALNGLALMVFAFVPVLLGLSARVLRPGLADADIALTVLTSVPLVIGGLALAAVFSAELSAADAVLFMLSTSASQDLYRSFVRPSASDADLLRVARWSALAGGLVGFGLTFVYPAVLDALTAFYSVLVVSLFAPILGGLYLPRGGRWGALAAMLVGITTLALTSVTTSGAGYGWAAPHFLGLVASGLTYLIFAAF
jgi:solute:Na+ symporter, SSS family